MKERIRSHHMILIYWLLACGCRECPAPFLPATSLRQGVPQTLALLRLPCPETLHGGACSRPSRVAPTSRP